MVMSGMDTSKIKEVSWNRDFDKYNEAIKKNYLDDKELKKLEVIQLGIEEFDRMNQQNWFIPDEYKNLEEMMDNITQIYLKHTNIKKKMC